MLLSSCFLEFWQLQNLCIFVKMSKATAKLGMPWDAKTSSRERDHQPEHKWNNMKRKWFEAKTLHSSKKHKTSAKCLSWWELQFLHARSLLPMPPSFVVAVFIDVTRSWLWHNYFPRYANGLKSWMLLPVFNLSSAIFPFLTISSGTAISLLRSSRIALSDFNRPRASSLRWILYTWEERKGLENDEICWNAVGEILWKNENFTKQNILHLVKGKNSACWDSGQFQRFIRRFFSEYLRLEVLKHTERKPQWLQQMNHQVIQQKRVLRSPLLSLKMSFQLEQSDKYQASNHGPWDKGNPCPTQLVEKGLC